MDILLKVQVLAILVFMTFLILLFSKKDQVYSTISGIISIISTIFFLFLLEEAIGSFFSENDVAIMFISIVLIFITIMVMSNKQTYEIRHSDGDELKKKIKKKDNNVIIAGLVYLFTCLLSIYYFFL